MLKTLITLIAGGAVVAGVPIAWRFIATRSNTQVHRVNR